MLNDEDDITACMADARMVQWARHDGSELTRRLLAGCVFCLLGAFAPGQEHLRHGHVMIFGIFLGFAMSMVFAPQGETPEQLAKRAEYKERAAGVGRVAFHLLISTVFIDSEFWHLIALVVLPLSCARQSMCVRSCGTQLVVHVALSVYRLSKRAATYESSVLMTHAMLLFMVFVFGLETSKERDEVRSKEAHEQNDKEFIAKCADTTTMQLLHKLCDAGAIIGPDLCILEKSPSLESLLEISTAAGQDFMRFVDSKYYMETETMLRQALMDHAEKRTKMKRGQHKTLGNPVVQSSRVCLMGPCGVKVDVHLFIVHPTQAQDSRCHVGILRTWRPGAASTKDLARRDHQSQPAFGSIGGAFETETALYEGGNVGTRPRERQQSGQSRR
eukprot:TRINITY_DN28000_c0_g1_i1.p1 TRINITY_DN28000_c0_g1~~TRINITY_DN28000_c0_g1_i1.p1  ORF type:complete len:388 (-),score=34.26 TRINITY_DN28000_c0_g1_i1:108-1271(-)